MRVVLKIPKVNSNRFVMWSALVLTIISETLISVELIEDSIVTKAIQYSIILVSFGMNILVMESNSATWRKKLLFKDELKTMSRLVGLLGCLSMYRSMVTGQFAFNSIMQMVQIGLPFVFVFFMLNLLTFDEIASFMKITLFFTLIGYFISVDFFSVTWDVFVRMMVVSTYSPFENSVFAEVASGLGAYFIYNRKKMPIEAVLAILLNFLVWKRVLVLMVLVLLFVSFRNKSQDVLKRKTVYITSTVWVVAVFAVYFIYQPEVAEYINARFHINLVEITSARLYRLWYCFETGFQSYGLGSTSNYISANATYLGMEFEMDFMRILFEVGPIAIFAICYSYLKITRGNKYSFFLICFCFLNLLMANGILKYWGYTLRVMTIAIINYYDENKKLVDPGMYSGYFIRLTSRWRGLGERGKNEYGKEGF